jgi:hypothetical protein
VAVEDALVACCRAYWSVWEKGMFSFSLSFFSLSACTFLALSETAGLVGLGGIFPVSRCAM